MQRHYIIRLVVQSTLPVGEPGRGPWRSTPRVWGQVLLDLWCLVKFDVHRKLPRDLTLHVMTIKNAGLGRVDGRRRGARALPLRVKPTKAEFFPTTLEN